MGVEGMDVCMDVCIHRLDIDTIECNPTHREYQVLDSLQQSVQQIARLCGKVMQQVWLRRPLHLVVISFSLTRQGSYI